MSAVAAARGARPAGHGRIAPRVDAPDVRSLTGKPPAQREVASRGPLADNAPVLAQRGSADDEDPPPPTKQDGEGARKPWAKPVITTLFDVTSTGDGAKQPNPAAYEGRPDPAALYNTYGPFQQL